MNDEKKQAFTVKDRRRFDEEGQSRGDGEDSVSAESEQVGAEIRSEGEDGFSEDAENGTPPEITFTSFVMSLATQALMQLGHLKAPEGVDIPVDLQAAQQTIDILDMLDEKTKGNLDEEEAKLLEDLLHNLRMGFVAVKNAAAS